MTATSMNGTTNTEPLRSTQRRAYIRENLTRTPAGKPSRQIRGVHQRVNSVWYVEEFDRKSQEFVHKFALRGVDTATLQSILGFGDTYEIDGIHYPPEAGGYDIHADAFPVLSKYINEPFVHNSESIYQAEFYVDQGRMSANP